MTLPAHPLQSIIAKAAKSLPAETGATAQYKQRLDRAGDQVVILCDTSGSMEERAGVRRKIEHLRGAVAGVIADLPDGVLVAFDSSPRRVTLAADIPEPSGGTALHLALDEAAKLRPAKTIVISDGEPDSESAALAAAERLSGIIDVIYCGRDSDARALDFMRRLARAGGGQVVTCDLVALVAPRRSLESGVRKLVGLPAPGY